MCTCSRQHNITPPEFLLAAYKIDSVSPTAHSNLSHGESCLNSQSPYAKLRKPGTWNFFSFLLLREPSFQSHCCCSHCLLAPAAEDNLLITFATHTLMYHLSLIISPHCMFFHSRQLFRLFCLVLPALSVHTNKPKKLAMQNSARCFETLIAASSRQFPFFSPLRFAYHSQSLMALCSAKRYTAALWAQPLFSIVTIPSVVRIQRTLPVSSWPADNFTGVHPDHKIAQHFQGAFIWCHMELTW